jgi:sialic acid synthase SpsE
MTQLPTSTPVKKRTPSEEKNVSEIRRSVVAARPLQIGSILKRSDLICKRPGTGIAPEHLNVLVGKKITKPLEEDEPLHWDHVK